MALEPVRQSHSIVLRHPAERGGACLRGAYCASVEEHPVPVVVFAPNLYQWLRKMRAGLPVEGYGTTQVSPFRWQWKPDWRYAVILSLLLVTVILKLNDPSEFIYFQF